MIIPFSFGEEELNLDESVSTMCSISKGDLPIAIWWQFHETDESLQYNLTTNDGIVISRPSNKISILAIDAVKSRHRGNYTCFASNKAGVAQYSTYLAINGIGEILINSFFMTLLLRFCNLFSIRQKFCR